MKQHWLGAWMILGTLAPGCDFASTQTITTVDTRWAQSALSPPSAGPAGKGLMAGDGQWTLEGGATSGAPKSNAPEAKQYPWLGHARIAHSWDVAEVGVSGQLAMDPAASPAASGSSGERPDAGASAGAGIDLRIALARGPRARLVALGEFSGTSVSWFRSMDSTAMTTTTTFRQDSRGWIGPSNSQSTSTSTQSSHEAQQGRSNLFQASTGLGFEILLTDSFGITGGVLLRTQPALLGSGQSSTTCDWACGVDRLNSKQWESREFAAVGYAAMVVRTGPFDTVLQGAVSGAESGTSYAGTLAVQWHPNAAQPVAYPPASHQPAGAGWATARSDAEPLDRVFR